MPSGGALSAVVLVVDDELEMRESLKAFLMTEFDGLEILTASGPDQALEILADRSVDLILSDHRMPGMTGLDFLKQARERYPDTIRILMTGATETALARRAIDEGGVHRFFSKPIDPDEIARVLREVLAEDATEPTDTTNAAGPAPEDRL